MLAIRPSMWSRESQKEYSSIVFSSAIIHFPLGLILLISGILLGELSNYIDLAVGATLLSSGIVAAISTFFPNLILICLSGILTIGSGLLSFAFLLSTIIILSTKEWLHITNPLGWIYILYSAFGICLEVLQLYMEVTAVRNATYTRSRTYSQTVPLNSDQHAPGRSVGDIHSPTGTKPTYFSTKDARPANSVSS